MRTAVALIAIMIAAPLPAQTVIATTGDIKSPTSKKDQSLSQLFDVLVPSGPIAGALIAAYTKRFKADWDKENGAELEAKYPGLFAATVKAGSETYAAGIDRHLPKLKIEYIKLAGSRLTDLEAQEFAQLLSSPSGQRLMGSVLSSLSLGRSATDARTRAVAALQSNASAEEMQTLSKFSEGTTAKKLLDIRTAFRPLIAKWASALNTETNPLILQSVEEATTQFVVASKLGTRK